MKFKKIILLSIIVLPLCSCKKSSFDWDAFLNNFSWTKWTSQDGKLEIFEEGNPSYTLCTCRYYLDDGNCINGVADLHHYVYASKEPDVYISFENGEILSLSKRKIDEQSFEIYNNEISYVLNAVPIGNENILIKYINFPYLVLDSDGWVFSSPTLNNIYFSSPSLFFESFYKGQYIKLTFNDDNSFFFKTNDLYTEGMSYPDCEKVTLKFSENQIFNGINELTFIFGNGPYEMNDQATYGLDLDSIF